MFSDAREPFEGKDTLFQPWLTSTGLRGHLVKNYSSSVPQASKYRCEASKGVSSSATMARPVETPAIVSHPLIGERTLI